MMGAPAREDGGPKYCGRVRSFYDCSFVLKFCYFFVVVVSIFGVLQVKAKGDWLRKLREICGGNWLSML